MVLLERMPAPERVTLTDAYRQWGGALLAYALLLCNRRAWAEEARQNLFANLAANPSLIEEALDPKAYLFASLRREALAVRERERRWWRLRTERPRDFLQPAPGEALSPEACREIEDAVRALPEAHREVVMLRIWAGLSFVQIGECCRTSPRTLESRYRTALGTLRQRLRSIHD